MAGVWDGPAAGDPLAFPLVESVQLIGIVADAPLLGIQILPLIKLVPRVFPVSVQSLRSTNGKPVRRAPSPPPAFSVCRCPTAENSFFPAKFSPRMG